MGVRAGVYAALPRGRPQAILVGMRTNWLVYLCFLKLTPQPQQVPYPDLFACALQRAQARAPEMLEEHLELNSPVTSHVRLTHPARGRVARFVRPRCSAAQGSLSFVGLFGPSKVPF